MLLAARLVPLLFHHLGTLNRRFLGNNPALGIVLALSQRLLDYVNPLDQNTVLRRIGRKDFADLAPVLTSDHHHHVVSFHVQILHELEHLGSERNNLGKILVAQLARYGSKNTRPLRVVLIVNDHHGVIVESHVRTVGAAQRRPRPDDHTRYNFALFHRSICRGFLHMRLNDIANPRKELLVSENANRPRHAGAGVVRNIQMGANLNHTSTFSIPVAFSTTCTNRHRFSLLSGRDSTMRTLSPTPASLFSSCA